MCECGIRVGKLGNGMPLPFCRAICVKIDTKSGRFGSVLSRREGLIVLEIAYDRTRNDSGRYAIAFNKGKFVLHTLVFVWGPGHRNGVTATLSLFVILLSSKNMLFG